MFVSQTGQMIEELNGKFSAERTDLGRYIACEIGN